MVRDVRDLRRVTFELGVCLLKITVVRSDAELSRSGAAAHYKLCRTDRKACARFGIASAGDAFAQGDLSFVAAELEHAIPRRARTDATTVTRKLAGSEEQRVAINLHVCRFARPVQDWSCLACVLLADEVDTARRRAAWQLRDSTNMWPCKRKWSQQGQDDDGKRLVHQAPMFKLSLSDGMVSCRLCGGKYG